MEHLNEWLMYDRGQLDNPVWHSLIETHHEFAIDYGGIKFYHPDYCPFGGFMKKDNMVTSIADYASLVNDFYIVGERPLFAEPLQLHKELVCLQMVATGKIDKTASNDIIKLSEEHRDELFRLVNLVQPGYFKRNTFLLGDYYGIFNDDQLVAVTGERMRMDACTEVSAVVTHPDHTGRGYAKQLVAHVANAIFDQDKTPYLHVAETNTGAIQLYEKLGFRVRRKISFWNLVMQSNNSEGI